MTSRVSSQLADFLRLVPTPASADEVGRSAVNREAVRSNPARGANLLFMNQLEHAKAFGSLPNAVVSRLVESGGTSGKCA